MNNMKRIFIITLFALLTFTSNAYAQTDSTVLEIDATNKTDTREESTRDGDENHTFYQGYVATSED